MKDSLASVPKCLILLFLFGYGAAAFQEIGCDGVAGSGQRLDDCGVCGGDGSGCQKVAGLFARQLPHSGYVSVTEIPAGAANVNVSEMRRSRNYLALIDKATGRSIINGNWTLSRTGPYRAVGAEFRYLRPRYSLQGESIFALGPLTGAVELMILAQEKNNPGFSYSYVTATISPQPDLRRVPQGEGQGEDPNDIPKPIPYGVEIGTTDTPSFGEDLVLKDVDPDGQTFSADDTPVASQGGATITQVKIAASGLFNWKVTKPSNCSRTCGGGESVAKAACLQLLSNVIVTDENCFGIKKPAEYSVPCNTQPCEPGWASDDWSSCSTTCGPGLQRRSVACRQRVSPHQVVSRPATECPDRRPATMQSCDLKPCYSWSIGQWSQCSAKCGDGRRRRPVDCVDALGRRRNESDCPISKPSGVSRCKGDCSHTWLYSAWSNKCSADCGSGRIERQVYCPADNHILSGSSKCGARPLTSRLCATFSECGGQWFTGPWNECVGPCGEGTQTREVYCMIKRVYWHSVTYNKNCPAELKPPAKQTCQSAACFIKPQWFISEWGACSETCGRGFKKRAVQCLDSRFRMSLDCPKAPRPKTQSVCRNPDCHQKPAKNVQATDASCTDTYKNCPTAAQAGLCRMSSFGDKCCLSCRNMAASHR